MGYMMCRFIRYGFQAAKSVIGGIEIGEQLLEREGFGKFSLVQGSKIQLNQAYRLGTSFNCKDGDWGLDSWLVSFISNHHWKWIYNLPHLQDTKSRHHLTNAFIVSLAVADFCVGLIGIPSMFFFVTLQTPATGLNFGCDCLGQILQDACLARNTSVVNLCLLVLDRFIAIVHPLEYITFMTRRRTTRAIVFSWVLTVSFNALKVIHLVFYVKAMCVPFIWLHLIFFEFLPSVVLILRFVSMIFHVRKHDRSTRIVACSNN